MESFDQIQGAELADPSTGLKKYWKFLDSFLNNCETPKIQPIFNTYLAEQCIPVMTKYLNYLSLPHKNRLSHFNITTADEVIY